MKSLRTNVSISRISSRVDGSLGIGLQTPELTPTEKTLFMELHGVNCSMVLTPIDTPSVPEVKIDKDVASKSDSERLRAVLFLIWKQEGEKGEFKDFYHSKMESLIEKLKERLPSE